MGIKSSSNICILSLSQKLVVNEHLCYKTFVLIMNLRMDIHNSPFHYPPEIFNLLIDTIPLLCRSKKDVILFFKGAGVEDKYTDELSHIINLTPNLINKYEITRNILTKINSRGDSYLGVRREILKRITEFDNFDTCWESDRLKAKGLVSELRKTINIKDSFTRLKQERDAEREKASSQHQAKQAKLTTRNEKIEEISSRLNSLFNMDDHPQNRGKLLESILNDLFKVYNIHICEDFCRRSINTGSTLEQIDGVIEFKGHFHLVEIKWLSSPVGIADFSQHLSRLHSRSNVCGIFISASGYTEAVLQECQNVLCNKTIFLCTVREFVLLLYRKDDLIEFLDKKFKAAVLDKNPFLEILH